MNGDEILFTTQMKYTFEEYVRYSDRVSRSANFLSYVIWLGAGLALGWLAFSKKDYGKVLIMVIGCAGLIIRGRLARKKNLQEAFEEPDSVANRMITHHFYRNGFEQICDTVASERIRYSDLRKIIETKTNFYLMYGRREGSIIVKENCSPGLIYFLRNLKDEPESPLLDEEKEVQLTYHKTTKKIIENVGCPYEIISPDTPEQEVMKWYQLALEQAGENGYPVIVPVSRLLLESLETAEEEGYDRNEMLRRDLADGKRLLHNWYQEASEEEEFIGTMEQGDELNHFLSFTEFAGEYEEFILFKIPVDEPWKVMAYLPIGGWNGCPETEDMLAICRYWYEKYRAVPAVVGYDTMEFLTGREVRTEQDAWDLAKEHFAFCEDVVLQCTGTSTIGELADSLRKSKVWYFWWD